MDNKKRKICIVTANRAEYSRVKTIIDAILKHPDLDLKLVVTGSHLLEKYGNTMSEIEEGGVVASRRMYMELDGNNLCSMTKSVGIAIADLATYFDNEKMDAVIVMGDRYEAFAVAIAASVMNIPTAHVQGGEVTGTIDESIRHAITKLSHIHFPATEKSRERVIKMGENPDFVFEVGCPGADLLLAAPEYSRQETIEKLNSKHVRDRAPLNPSEHFILAIQHPVTTEFNNNFDQTQEMILALKKIKGFQKLIIWPNIDAGSGEMVRAIRRFQNDPETKNVFFLKHVFHDIFVNLLRHADCLIGNSSSGIRESCYFGTPTVNIGTRQQGRERGQNVIDASYDGEAIYQAILHQMAHGKYEPEFIYGNGQAGKKIADILAKADLSKIQKTNTY